MEADTSSTDKQREIRYRNMADLYFAERETRGDQEIFGKLLYDAVTRERERCAKIVEESNFGSAALSIADKIRAVPEHPILNEAIKRHAVELQESGKCPNLCGDLEVISATVAKCPECGFSLSDERGLPWVGRG